MSLINEKKFQGMITKINSFTDLEDKACEELQKYLDELVDYLKKQLMNALKSNALLSVLTQIPTDLAGVINWIKGVISYISGPANKIMLEYAELVLMYGQLMEAIANVSSHLQCGLTINVNPPSTEELTDAMEGEIA